MLSVNDVAEVLGISKSSVPPTTESAGNHHEKPDDERGNAKKANFMSAQGKENFPPTETITAFSEEEVEEFKAEAFSVFGNGKRLQAKG